MIYTLIPPFIQTLIPDIHCLLGNPQEAEALAAEALQCNIHDLLVREIPTGIVRLPRRVDDQDVEEAELLRDLIDIVVTQISRDIR